MKITININGINLTATMAKKKEGTTSTFNLMHTIYCVVLSVSGRKATFTFHDSHRNWQLGIGATKESIYDAIDCIIGDAYDYLNARNFYDFCNEFGYDPETDTRTAKMAYNGCQKAYEKLTNLLIWEDVEKLNEIVRGEN